MQTPHWNHFLCYNILWQESLLHKWTPPWLLLSRHVLVSFKFLVWKRQGTVSWSFFTSSIPTDFLSPPLNTSFPDWGLLTYLIRLHGENVPNSCMNLLLCSALLLYQLWNKHPELLHGVQDVGKYEYSKIYVIMFYIFFSTANFCDTSCFTLLSLGLIYSNHR